ncbi:hypothetical protein D3C81_1639440 [compost metagenome]
MVDQRDLAVGTEAHLQKIADVVGLAQKYTLLAVTGDHQAIQLNGRRGARYARQRLIQ